MSRPTLIRICQVLIALVWLINGLICKVLMLVPRHHEIVSRILGDTYSEMITRGIGLGEIGIAAWILSGIKSRICAVFQIVLVATMNTMEYFLARDLLLWGAMNAVYALLFIALVAFYEFGLNRELRG
ncbi:MAG: DoxX-like family protein [Verrucomicrobiota bacterium]